jgi:exodeoxyribonuclease-3
MREIMSWNVNGIRAVEKKGFVEWIGNSGADIVCIQETKAQPSQLSAELINPVIADRGGTYFSYWASAKKAGYSGTAMYSRTEPDSVSFMGYPEFDDEGRVLIARFGKLAVISAYFPNSQDAGARLGYKLDFCDAILETCNKFVAAGTDIILCGDYNIAHKAIDLANPKSNEKNPGFLPEERAWMDVFTGAGYCDTFRNFCPDGGHYSWWSYRFHAREKNIGWRIDYHCVNQRLLEKVQSSVIRPDITGSDHCPVQLVLDTD